MSFRDLTRAVLDIQFRLAEIERRGRNANRIGTIASDEDIDAEKGLARVTLADKDGKTYKSGWLPWSEQSAGATKTHFPPSKGQQVRVRSQNGELSDAEIELSVPSDTNTRASKKADENVILDRGKTRIAVSDGGDTVTLSCGASSITITDGEIRLKAPKIHLN
ncbi:MULTISPECIES: phage baseplate assembly protein V [unclassified Chelatococcus]|uniref:phage baseplate assembly protein V n=1 Tax=unclassified Chelatococcus TaxID=2638111 RepID=UPI001BCD5817|nr:MULTISPECIES: phage baseplate assembly protein V [unclassified Chelatococcus]MBS7737780.1 phage baseplate assembly protein V [Chelatococcus sp. HY11]MCO5079236.1 phage baseplate assembly protein V [Chelatococcus sp.]CAH1665839.1 Phage_base_V domain-containing protein [Hyphomicrobiales bacterium]CAH1681072.1 Phage_base_V domain-containing protein [Hyphomicrobiales bacterium]